MLTWAYAETIRWKQVLEALVGFGCRFIAGAAGIDRSAAFAANLADRGTGLLRQVSPRFGHIALPGLIQILLQHCRISDVRASSYSWPLPR